MKLRVEFEFDQLEYFAMFDKLLEALMKKPELIIGFLTQFMKGESSELPKTD